MICTTDCTTAEPAAPSSDQKVKLRLREFAVEAPLSKKQKTMTRQMFYPGFWELRIINTTSPKQIEIAMEEADGLDNAFEGMRVAST